MRVLYSWVGKYYTPLGRIKIRGRDYTKFINNLVDIMYKEKKISRLKLVETLMKSDKYSYSYTKTALGHSVGYLSKKLRLLDIIADPNQAQFVAKKARLSEKQVKHYSEWLVCSGLFPSHKKDRGIYSKKEQEVIINAGNRMYERGIGAVLALRTSIWLSSGIEKLEKFDLWWREYSKSASIRNKKRREKARNNDSGQSHNLSGLDSIIFDHDHISTNK